MTDTPLILHRSVTNFNLILLFGNERERQKAPSSLRLPFLYCGFFFYFFKAFDTTYHIKFKVVFITLV